jgi:hypothetical protein
MESDRMTDSESPQDERTPKDGFHIQIDREHFTVHQEDMTGAQIRQIPNPPIGPDRDLFEVGPAHSDVKIEETTVVEIRDGIRFFTAPSHINPGGTNR